MAIRTLIFEITWSGSQTATLEVLRDNRVDVIHAPKSGTHGRIRLSWPATDELQHDIDWDLWAAGSKLTNLRAVARWKDESVVHDLAPEPPESVEHNWPGQGTL
jgi:hypothetical protein